ncbi:hypothetical protein CF328_g8959, partial [Tilletia controversa]
YFEALNPYIFAPTKPYISRDDLTRPRSLGGFNLLHPDHMAIALSISFLRNYLSDPGPIGSWLRLNLTAELHHRYSAVPAILLARSSPAFTALQHADARAEGLFGRLLHALASVDLGLAPEWKDLPEAALVTLPWLLLFPSPTLTDQRQVKYLRSHWVTVGDMLWLGPQSHPAAPVPSYLGLPPSRSATAHNRLSSARDRFGGVPSLPWLTMWSQLEPRLATALTSHCLGSPTSYRLLTPDALRSRTPSETWILLSVDPAYPSFPWHLLTIAGRSILTASPRSVRRSLTPQEPRVPGWTLDPPVSPIFWSTVWTELEASPLPTDMRSACLLVLGQNLWTYRPAPPRRLNCPVGCPEADSPTHGICVCPAALRIWSACLPLLQAMGVSTPLSFSPRTIIGAWQHLPGLRGRLVLWRNAVLVTLHTARTIAGRDARTSASPPNFHHCDAMDVLSFTTASVVSALTSAWSRLPQESEVAIDRFHARWILGSSLLHIEGSSLVVTALPTAPPPPATAP